MSKEEIDNSQDVSAYLAGEPYVGPRPFKRDDRDLFFGRQRETLELTSLIKAHPELLIYAQSGAGKTSLIDAQLVPTLETEEEFEVLPLARVRSRTAQSMADEKIKNIYMFNALADLSAGSLTLLERAQLTLSDYLERRPRPLFGPPKGTTDDPQAQTPAEIENQEPPIVPRAIIFDQFEELFTLYPHRYKDRQDFFDQVKDALETDSLLRVVFSMREDYIAELDPYIDTLPQKLSTRFRLEPLRKANALKAVIKPLTAKRVINEREFAHNAAETLVESLMLIKVKTVSGDKKEVLGEFVDPVQLQVVCQTLWEQLPPTVKIITEDHLKEYANVDAALLTYYENSIRKVINAANPDNDLTASGEQAALAVMEAKVRKWFEKLLITPEGKRNMIPQGASETGTATTAFLPNDLVNELENQHLIRAEIRGEDDKWYELSHDRLIAPIIESNRRWILQQPWAKRKAEELEARCVQWIKSKKDPELLLDREALAKAKNWRESAEAQAIGSTVELDLFIRESQAAIEAEDHRQTRLLASEQSARANAEHQRARVFRLGLVVASVLLLVASIATVRAITAERRATGALAAARKAEAEATEEKTKAEDALEAEKLAKEEVTAEKRKTDDALKAAEDAEARALAEKKRTEVALQAETVAKTLATEETEKANEERERANKQRNLSDSLVVSKEIAQRSPGDPELGLSLALIASEKWSNFGRVRTDLRTAFVNWPDNHFVLGKQGESVQNAVFTPDGDVVITSRSKENDIESVTATVKVWSLADRKYTLERKAHARGIAAIAVSNDSMRLATEGEDGTGRIWWLKDGTYKELKGLTGPWPAIVFSRDGKFVASEGTIEDSQRGRVVFIWDAEDPKKTEPVAQLTGHESAITAIAFSPTDNNVVAAASEKGAVLVWDRNKKEPKKLSGHTNYVNSVSFDPSGKLVVTASNDGTARVWDTVTGKEEWSLPGHVGIVMRAIFSHDGQRILTIGRAKSVFRAPQDNLVRIWDVKKRALSVVIGGHTAQITDARFSSDSKMIVTASEDGTAHIWRATDGRHIMPFKDHNGGVFGASLSSDNNLVLTATDQGVHVSRIPPPTTFFARKIDDNPFGQVSVDFDSDEQIVTLGTDGSVRFWDPKTREENTTKQIELPDLPPLDVSEIDDNLLADIKRSPEGRYVAMAFQERRDQPNRKQQDRPDSMKDTSILKIWDTRAEKYVALVPAPDTPISKLEFSPKGKYLLSAGKDGTATLWETASWKGRSLKIQPVSVSSAHGSQPVSPGRILAAAFDSTEQWLVTGHQSGIVEVFRAADGEYFGNFRTHQKSVSTVAFGQGDRFITGGADGTAALWTIDSVQPLVRITHPSPVIDAKLSDNDMFIVTVCEDDFVRVWENTAADAAADKENISASEDGILVAQFKTPFTPFSVAFSPNNKYLAVGSAEGWGQVFSCAACLPFEELRSAAIKRNPRPLTKTEQDAMFGPDNVKPKGATANKKPDDSKKKE